LDKKQGLEKMELDVEIAEGEHQKFRLQRGNVSLFF